MNHKNLVFLGTSHIAKQSLDDVKRFIDEIKPDILAVELDRKRLPVLMENRPRKIDFRSIRVVGLKGFVFSLIGAWAEKKLGRLVGVSPGSEMKQAIRIAKQKKLKLALIDQDIEITLKRLSQELTWKEKLNFLTDIFKAIFSRKKKIDFDLRTVPNKKIIRQLMQELKERYPNIHKVLVEERNIVIAHNLKKLAEQNPDKKVLVILGAGHVDDVLELLKEQEISYRFSVG